MSLQIFWGLPRIFARTSSNVPKNLCLKNDEDLFVLKVTQSTQNWLHPKTRSSSLKSQNQTYFDSQSHSSHNENKGVEISVPVYDDENIEKNIFCILQICFIAGPCTVIEI